MLAHRLILGLLAVVVVSTLTADTFAQTITAGADVSNGQPQPGDQVDVDVLVDLSDVSDKLGAYAAKLVWDANVLRFMEAEDGETSAFAGPQTNASTGQLLFSNFSTVGDGGLLSLIKVKFEVIGKAGEHTALTLSFTALDASGTFKNLLPQLQVRPAPAVTVATSGPVPPVENGDGLIPRPGDATWSMDLNTAAGDQQVREKNLAAGQKFIIELINNQSISPALGGSFTLSYDTTKVEPDISTISGIAAQLGAATLSDGTVSFTLASLSGVAVDKGYVGQIEFKTLDGFQGETEIVLTKAEIGDASTFGNVATTPNSSVVIRSDSASRPTPDFDGDGSVGFRDFILFAQFYGKDPSTFGVERDLSDHSIFEGKTFP
jgi:hypothetical protein